MEFYLHCFIDVMSRMSGISLAGMKRSQKYKSNLNRSSFSFLYSFNTQLKDIYNYCFFD